MKIERTRNATRNIVWGTIERIALLLLPFITRTVLIRTIGVEYLGLSSLFSSILSVLSISELGIGVAIVFSMYKPVAEDDRDMICALLNTYRKVYRIVGTIILVAGLAVMPFLPKLIKDDVPPDINIYILYIVYLFNAAISYFLYAYKGALFAAYQRNDLTSKRAAVISLASNILKVAVLILFRNYYVFVIVVPLTTIATNLTNAWMAKKIFPDLDSRGEITGEMRADIKKRIIGLLSFRIYSVVFAAVDSIVISAFLGLKPVAVFNNYHYIQSTVVGFVAVFTASVVAGIGNKMVTSSVQENYQDFKRIVFINGWIVGWCSVCMLCLYQPFMEFWVGGDLLFPTSTMVLMVFYFMIPRISTITHTYRDAAGLWWEDRFRPLIATVVNLATNIILVKTIGMNGVILSTLICSVFINIPWGSIILFRNYFKISSAEYFRKLLFYIFVTCAAGAVTYLLCEQLPLRGIPGMLVRLLICAVLPNTLFWLVYHRLDEYGYAKKMAKQAIRAAKTKLGRK